MNELELECGHSVYTDVELRQQYEPDEHYVFCPTCRQSEASQFSWKKVLNNERVSDVHESYARIMPNDILRLQPTVPRYRKRPFPYVNGVDRRVNRKRGPK